MRQAQTKKGYSMQLSKRRWQRKAYGDIRAHVYAMYKHLEEQKRKKEEAAKNPQPPKEPPRNKPNRLCQFQDKAPDNRTKEERMSAAGRYF